MGLLTDQLMKMLSARLGMTLSAREMNLSLLRGALEVVGLVAGPAAAPLVELPRATAKLAVGRALSGDIIFRSLEMHRPIVRLKRCADGTWNLRPPVAAGEGPDIDPVSQERTSVVASKWALGLDRMQIVDAEVHVDISEGSDSYRLSARPVQVNLLRTGDGYEINLHIGSIARTDIESGLGPVQVTARLKGVADLLRAMDAALTADAEIGDQIHVRVQSDQLNRMGVRFDANGDVDPQVIVPLLPPSMVARMPQFQGRLTFQVGGSHSPTGGLQLDTAEIRAEEVRVHLRSRSS